VVSEIALSLVLLVGAGVLVNSFLRLQAVDPGFDASRVLVVRLSLPRTQYPDRATATAFYDRLRPGLAALPGVESVGVVSALPLSGVSATIPFTIEGRAAAPDEAMLADYRLVSTGYFRALRIPVLAGREFTERDSADTAHVALVSQRLARRYWPDGSPLGAHLQIDDNDRGPRPVEIVGVVGDVKHLGLDEEPAPHIYLPIHQTDEDAVIWLTNNQYWLLRTAVDPLTLSTAVRRAIQAVDREVPASSIRTMEDYLAASVAPRRFNLWLLTIFAGAALVLAATGLYGVISCGVTQRRREIGIRMALGAQRTQVLALVLGHGLILTTIGITAGIAGAAAGTRLLEGMLFGITRLDPLTFGAVSLVFGLVATVASYLPARRATTVDPMVALRSE
jgi:putative ABC transport system permease protein